MSLYSPRRQANSPTHQSLLMLRMPMMQKAARRRRSSSSSRKRIKLLFAPFLPSLQTTAPPTNFMSLYLMCRLVATTTMKSDIYTSPGEPSTVGGQNLLSCTICAAPSTVLQNSKTKHFLWYVGVVFCNQILRNMKNEREDHEEFDLLPVPKAPASDLVLHYPSHNVVVMSMSLIVADLFPSWGNNSTRK